MASPVVHAFFALMYSDFFMYSFFGFVLVKTPKTNQNINMFDEKIMILRRTKKNLAHYCEDLVVNENENNCQVFHKSVTNYFPFT